MSEPVAGERTGLRIRSTSGRTIPKTSTAQKSPNGDWGWFGRATTPRTFLAGLSL